MGEIEFPVTFRAYQPVDFEPVAALWTRINRELAPYARAVRALH